jgi:hypothetical protein
VKIGIAISGIPRYWSECYSSQRMFFELFFGKDVKIDYYIDAWSRVDKSKYVVKKRYTKDPDTFDVDRILKLYKPVDYRFEVFNEEKGQQLCDIVGIDDEFQRSLASITPNITTIKNCYEVCPTCGVAALEFSLKKFCCVCGGSHLKTNTVPMLWKIKGAFDLIPDPKQYDYIVRTRFDNLIEPIIDRSILSILDSTVVCPKWGRDSWQAPNDQLFISSPSNMKIICNAYYDIKKIMKKRLIEHGSGDPAHYFIPAYGIPVVEAAIFQRMFVRHDMREKDKDGFSQLEYFRSLVEMQKGIKQEGIAV